MLSRKLANYDIRTIQELLGNSDVRTTMIYTHTIKSRAIKESKSPLDFQGSAHTPSPSVYRKRRAHQRTSAGGSKRQGTIAIVSLHTDSRIFNIKSCNDVQQRNEERRSRAQNKKGQACGPAPTIDIWYSLFVIPDRRAVDLWAAR